MDLGALAAFAPAGVPSGWRRRTVFDVPSMRAPARMTVTAGAPSDGESGYE